MCFVCVSSECIALLSCYFLEVVYVCYEFLCIRMCCVCVL